MRIIDYMHILYAHVNFLDLFGYQGIFGPENAGIQSNNEFTGKQARDASIVFVQAGSRCHPANP